MPKFRVTDNGKSRTPAGQQNQIEQDRFRKTEALSHVEAVQGGRMPETIYDRPFDTNLQSLGSTNQAFYGRGNTMWHIAAGGLQARTWEFEVNHASGSAGLFSFGAPWNVSNYGYELRVMGDGSLRWQAQWAGGAFQNSSAPGLFNFGAWNTIRITVNTSRVTAVFLNGVSVVSGTVGANITTGAGLLGMRVGYDNPGINGYMRNFYAVTYQSNPPSPLTNVSAADAYIPMDEGTGVKVFDVWNPDSTRHIEFSSVTWAPEP
jgi:hypothetical protein